MKDSIFEFLTLFSFFVSVSLILGYFNEMAFNLWAIAFSGLYLHYLYRKRISLRLTDLEKLEQMCEVPKNKYGR
jgi:hypothetical protein